MRILKTLALLLALSPGLALAQAENAPQPSVTELMTKALKDYPGKEIVLINVDYPPGAIEPIHHHDAHAVVYVLEGNIVMGVKGKPEQALKAGDTFYEGPEDIHTIGHNASKTAPAKFIVFILKDKKNPIVMPVK
jgi:quercetin dioxygenase-like cupin family protein